MKILFVFALLAVLATAVFAWDDEDHEIFDLVTAVETSEGKRTTFYSWLDVPSTATTAEISKAYRKMSMQLHPDKNPNVKGIHERFARLGVVATILRNKESRQRYDFFYKNGVPKWRGTGYYYSRFRPGLGFVLVFLTILTSGLQYIIQKINYKRDLERIERFMREARASAWGPKMIPIDGRRKVKINLGSPRDEDGNPTSGKWIDMVVEGQAVYILDPSGDLHRLDESAAVQPTITGTWFLSLVISLFRKVTKGAKPHTHDRNQNSKADESLDEAEGYDSAATGSEAPGSGYTTPTETGAKGRVAAVKAGGKRRKAVRKR